MESYKIQTCKDLQDDLSILGCTLDLDSVERFWLDYSDKLCAVWLGYQKGDIQMLKFAIDISLEDINN